MAKENKDNGFFKDDAPLGHDVKVNHNYSNHKWFGF
jgi:hypothetical protein